jgi:hypothetical protein
MNILNISWVVFCWAAAASFVAQAQAQPWPAVALPPDAEISGMAEQLVVRGQLMRVQSFTSKKGPQELAAWFGQSMGAAHVQNTVNQKLVVGRGVGNFFETVQLETSPNVTGGTRGTTSVAHLGQEPKVRTEHQATLKRWLDGLPSGTQVASDVATTEAGKATWHVAFVNTHSEQLNRQRLTELMRAEGYQLEHLADLLKQQTQRGQDPAHTLLFKGAGKEAMVTLNRDAQGNTTLVLSSTTVATTTAQLESMK